jgi:hypothetical protein
LRQGFGGGEGFSVFRTFQRGKRDKGRGGQEEIKALDMEDIELGFESASLSCTCEEPLFFKILEEASYGADRALHPGGQKLLAWEDGLSADMKEDEVTQEGLGRSGQTEGRDFLPELGVEEVFARPGGERGAFHNRVPCEKDHARNENPLTSIHHGGEMCIVYSGFFWRGPREDLFRVAPVLAGSGAFVFWKDELRRFRSDLHLFLLVIFP